MDCSSTTHGCHPPLHHVSLSHPLLELLLLKFLFNGDTERHRTFRLRTVFGVITTQRYQLLADGTAAVGLASTATCVRHHALHLLTARQSTVGVAALTRMHQRLNTSLDRQPTCLSRVLCCGSVAVTGGRASSAVVQVETDPLHLVWMLVLLVARDAQVKVLQSVHSNGCQFSMADLTISIELLR